MQLNANTIVGLCNGPNASNTNATQLTFQSMNIESIEAGVFDRYKSLVYLDLTKNNIRELPQGIFDSLGELKEVFIYANKLSTLHPQLFKENKKLKVIHVNSNEFTELNENELFQDLPELIKLDISSNKIKTFNFESLKDSPKLECLWFHDNNLTEIKGLDDLKMLFPNLKECSVNSNNFSCSYMQRIVESLEGQNIEIWGLDKSERIEAASVYGIKCIPDRVYPNSQGVELESKVTDMDAKLKQLSDENIKMREELNENNAKINGLEAALDAYHQENAELSKYCQEAQEEMIQLIGEMQLQQAGRDAKLQILKEELAKNNKRIEELEAAQEVIKQQNLQFRAELQKTKKNMWQELLR